MNAIKLNNNVYWVGAIDYNLRNFHGYSTSRGSSYNAYLIIDKDITLIDTVKTAFSDEMISRIKSVCDISQIKNIIINHAEPDHSGALPLLLKLAPNAKVFSSSPNGGKILKMHYGDINAELVNADFKLNIGERELVFVATPMVHWPDNMVTYSAKDKILFSNDAFGQHIASGERIDSDFDVDIQLQEARKYYANIVLPYSTQVGKALDNLKGLEISMIAPSHGLVWSEHINEILSCYKKMSGGEGKTKAVIIYDTMWGSTEKIAKAMAEGFLKAGVSASVENVQNTHISDIITKLLDAKYICIGSPTLNNGLLPTIASFLCYLKGLSPVGEYKYIAFGSYGWGGQSVGIIDTELKALKYKELMPLIKQQYYPKSEFLKDIEDSVAIAVKNDNN